MALLSNSGNVEVGFTITTANDEVRKIFEPNAPSIMQRIKALKKLHFARIRSFVMIAPVLPGAENLPDQLNDKVDYVLIDRMNYHYANWVYKKYGLEYAMRDEFFFKEKMKLSGELEKAGIPCQILF